MSTLYIRLPSKAAADGAEHWPALPCRFAVASSGEVVEREGIAALADLGGAMAAAQRVVLLLAASDVSVLRVKTPPLSAAKLKAALPNLIEEQLMTDPSECVVAAGELADGLRTAAVVNRGWLDILCKTMIGFGARSLVAVPAQLCLSLQDGRASAATTEFGADIDVSLRWSPHSGIGLPLLPDAAQVAVDVLTAVRALAPMLPLSLYVPQVRVAEYKEALRDMAIPAEQEISVYADNWSCWMGGANYTAKSLNLLAGISAGNGAAINWRQWRWALALAASVLLVNALALNIDWWRMKREAAALRSGMIQTYKATYPKETVILDALAQMQRKVADAERNAGQAAPDDFVQLSANFAEVLASESRDGGNGKPGAALVAAIEYRERNLLVHLKPDGQPSMEKMKFALAARKLTLSNPANDVWQIGSAK